MTWRFNPLTGNSIAYYNDFQIIRMGETERYELRVRFGLEHVYLPCSSFEDVMEKIKDGQWLA